MRSILDNQQTKLGFGDVLLASSCYSGLVAACTEAVGPKLLSVVSGSKY